MQQQPPGVVVAPELCHWLHVAALAQLHADNYRNGGASPPGLTELLHELRVSSRGRPSGRIGTVDPRWVTAVEAARLAGVSRRRIYQLAAAGQIRARRFGGSWQIDPDSARGWRTRREQWQ